MASRPFLPITEKPMTRRDAADLLTGLASLIENYPSDKVLLTVNVEIPTVSDGSTRRGASSPSTDVTPSKRSRGSSVRKSQ